MPLALLIIAAIGALLFLISLLSYAMAGFRHHFITGIIALLPVLNIVTLPSLWHKHKGKFFLGVFGLILFLAAWVLGGKTALNNLLSNNPVTKTTEIMIGQTEATTQTLNSDKKEESTPDVNELEMDSLPTKALYIMRFESIPVDRINTLSGRIVQITKNDLTVIEGRILSVSSASVMLESGSSFEVPLATIKALKLMVKK